MGFIEDLVLKERQEAEAKASISIFCGSVQGHTQDVSYAFPHLEHRGRKPATTKIVMQNTTRVERLLVADTYDGEWHIDNISIDQYTIAANVVAAVFHYKTSASGYRASYQPSGKTMQITARRIPRMKTPRLSINLKLRRVRFLGPRLVYGTSRFRATIYGMEFVVRGHNLGTSGQLAIDIGR
jgi:hypothetical protein